jgi:membrane-bound ClpP family serine protease
MNHAFESALGVLGTAVPLITFAFGLVFCMLNRSFMPMIGAVVLSTAAHVVFGVVIPEREPRVSLAEAVTEAVNSLKIRPHAGFIRRFTRACIPARLHFGSNDGDRRAQDA